VVASSFLRHLDQEHVAGDLETIGDYLPCGRCRMGRTRAADLRGVRFGRHERRVLLLAPGPDEKEGRVIERDRPGRAEDEALRRAILRLWRMGLLYIWTKTVKVDARHVITVRRYYETMHYEADRPVRREYRKRCVCLSPLGAVVVERLRPALESGSVIRWGALPDVIAQEIEETLDKLLDRVESGITKHRSLSMRIMGLCASVGGREEFYRRKTEDQAHERILKAIKQARESGDAA